MRPTSEVVYLVDEDLRVRKALSELLSSQERQHFSFGSAAEYLAFMGSDDRACTGKNGRTQQLAWAIFARDGHYRNV
jgi:FixJ family two-component response regulator